MPSKLDRSVFAAVLVAALGYFVDVYDLILFSVLRVASLKDLGLTPEQITTAGVFILNMQMIGMLAGGLLWGILGDRKGRLSVLFGSIVLYSVASIANGFVHSVEAYAALRFIAGVGLAGELGAGITLVSEMLPPQSRGYSTTIVATVGVLGGAMAGLLGDALPWRTSYIVGGVLGLALLILRISVHESGMFRSVRESDVRRGDLRMLFSSRERFVRYISSVFVGVPTWYVFGILILLSPEVGTALGMTEAPSAGRANVFAYIGLVLGDLASGLLSQLLKSRKKVLGIFLGMTAIFTTLYLCSNAPSLQYFYAICLMLGFSVGYWAVYITAAAEQFGTNLRATVTTTAPNLVRGSTVIIATAFTELKPHAGVLGGAAIVGAACFVISFMFLARLRETFGRDLDFVETDG